MPKQFRVQTIFGEDVLQPGSNVHVRLLDGKFTSVPVEKAKTYVGKTNIVYAKTRLNVPFQKLEDALMDIKGGAFTEYRAAKERLHTKVPAEGGKVVYVPNLAHILQGCSSENDRKKFLDEVHKSMQEFASNNSFQTVSRETLSHWATGRDVAPKNWMNFGALAHARTLHPDLAKFQQYFDDYQRYSSGNKRVNDVEENIYYAYYNWLVTRLVLGHLAEGGFASVKKNKNGNNNHNENHVKINLDSLKENLMNRFCQDLTTTYCAVPLTAIKEEEIKQTPKKQILPTLEDIGVPSKPRGEVIRDVAVIERVLLNQIASFLYDVSLVGAGKSYDFTKYVDLEIQSRLRNASMERKHLILTADEKKEATVFANKAYHILFNSEEGNNILKLGKGTMQRLKDVRHSLVPVYPSVMEEHVILSSNLKILDAYLHYLRQNEINIPARERISLEEKFSKGLKRLVEIDADFRKEFFGVGLNPILTENVNDYVYKARANVLDDDLSYNYLLGMIRNPFHIPRVEVIRLCQFLLSPELAQEQELIDSYKREAQRIQGHYTEKELTDILISYGLEEVVDKDFDIALLRKLKDPNLPFKLL